MFKVKLEYLLANKQFMFDEVLYTKIGDIGCDETIVITDNGTREIFPSNTLIWIADENMLDKKKTRKVYKCVEWVDVEVGERVRHISNLIRKYVGTKIDVNRIDLGEPCGTFNLPPNSLVILEENNI